MELSGDFHKKEEISDLINKLKPEIICLQETMLQKDTTFKLINYTGILKEDHLNRRSHGGVGIYLHESVPFKEINLYCF